MKPSTLARLGLSVLVLVLLLRSLPTGSLEATLRGAELPWVAAALALKAVAVVASAALWHSLLAPGLSPKFRGSLRTYAASLFAGLVGLGNLGGDAYRVTALGLDRADRGIASLLGERAWSFAGLVLAAGIGSWLVPAAGAWRPLLTALAVLGIAGLAVGLLFGPRLAARWSPRGVLGRTARQALLGFERAREPRRGLVAAGAMLALPLLTAASTWALFRAVGQPLDLGFTLFAANAAALVVMLPLSIQGVGVREGAFLLLFTGLGGIPASASVAASLLSLATGIALGLLGAVALWMPRADARTPATRSARDGVALAALPPTAVPAAASAATPTGVSTHYSEDDAAEVAEVASANEPATRIARDARDARDAADNVAGNSAVADVAPRATVRASESMVRSFGLLPLVPFLAAASPYGSVGAALAKLTSLLRYIASQVQQDLSFLPPGSAPLIMIFGGMFILALTLALSLLRPVLIAMSQNPRPRALPRATGGVTVMPRGTPTTAAASATSSASTSASASASMTGPITLIPDQAPVPPLPSGLQPPAGEGRTFEDGYALGHALPTPDLDSVLDAAERLGLGQAHVVTVEPHRSLVRLASCQSCRLRPAVGVGNPGCSFELGFLQGALASLGPRAKVEEVYCALAADGACEFEIRPGG